MKTVISNILIVMVLSVLASCGSKEKVVQTAAYREQPTECLGKAMDGSLTLKVWAKGTSRMEAIREAKKKVISEVLFQGIAGSGDCNTYPVVDAPNARTQHEQYFNKFFSDGGGFKKFVDEVEKRSEADNFQGANSQQVYGVVLKVDRPALKQRMQKDKIIE